MFLSTLSGSAAPVWGQQVRGMATLKDISIRLKSVKNIQKITQSMKMVSAAKFARAERDLKQVRPFGAGSKAFYENVAPEKDAEQPAEKRRLLIAISSDRGLCGAIHSGVAKVIKAEIAKDPSAMVACVGDKSRGILARAIGTNVLFACNEIGRLPPTFGDASKVAQAILAAGYNFTEGTIYYNYFRSVVSYQIATLPLFSLETITNSDKYPVYDSLDQEVVQSYLEYSLASLLFYAMKEAACSEQSSRMSAMDNASKNAGEMIDKLTLTFNRTRQAVITRELIEIISGAAAL
ncbi:unnamed protein product [Notodromas monacha]|uniref:ATP synthase subunit gamma n=1 Tax=Notodromas monacha TaxID=399045 RepID=A0A7R9BV14_9CRUS|nr:unnamed protein product [Notodromas monacha]CAG0921897.1 unnamed protein product [Notodromas monacha]